MPAIEAKNKREHPRWLFSLPVTLTDKNTGEVLRLVISNLSAGGMFVPCSHPLAVGTELEIHIRIDDSGFRVDAEGWVVRTVLSDGSDAGPTGMGIQFTVDGQLGWQFLRILTQSGRPGGNCAEVDRKLPTDHERVCESHSVTEGRGSSSHGPG